MEPSVSVPDAAFVAVGFVGGAGLTFTELDALDAGLEPCALTAVTVNV